MRRQPLFEPADDAAPAVAEDAEVEAEDVEAKDETEEAEGGVPMLEEIDEK